MTDTRPTVVVVGNHTQGLGIVRSAAAAGAAVWVVNDKRLSLVRFSRWLTGYKRLPAGTLAGLHNESCSAWLLKVLLELPGNGRSVLLGVDEDIIHFTHRHRAALQACYFIPPVQLDSIFDKFKFSQLVPESFRIETKLWNEAEANAIREPHRFVVKGRSGNAFRRATGQKAIGLDRFTPPQREQLFRSVAADQVILQADISSKRPVVSVCSFSVGGRIVGLFGYEKLRQHPNRFGTGTYLRSVSVDDVLPIAGELLKRLEFTGISEIEFIHDEETGTYRVIEMNPRTWKSVHFATQCGVNLVGQLIAHVRGEAVAAKLNYLRDRYWADLATDIPQMFRERKLWGYHRNFFECVWNRADMLPAVALWTLFPLLAVERSLTPRTNR